MSEHIVEVEYDTFNGTYTQKRHEEVVRCRDCVNFDPYYTDGAFFDETVCWVWDNGHDYPHYTVPDGFCYRGKRRDA